MERVTVVRYLAAMVRSGALEGGVAVLAAIVSWNLGNYVFFLLAGRILGPEDYGLVAALLAATVVILVPCGAFQYAVARIVAVERAAGVGSAGMYGWAWRRGLRASLVSVGGACAAILAVRAAGVEIPTGPALVTALVVAPMGLLMLGLGQLQGERRFAAYSLAMGVLGIPRPVLLVVLAGAGPALYAALVSSAAVMALAAAVAAALTWQGISRAPGSEPEGWRDFVRSLRPLLVGLTGVAALTNLDVIAAKLALADDAAGYFGAVAVLAKAVLVVPQTLSVLLVPHIAARRSEGRDTGPLLAVGVGVALATGGLASLLCVPLGRPIIEITFGVEYVSGADLLPPFAAASALFGAVWVLVNHHASRHADRFVWALGGLALVEVALLAFFHGSAGAIVAVDAVVAAVGIAIHEVLHSRDGDALVRSFAALLRRAARAAHSA